MDQPYIAPYTIATIPSTLKRIEGINSPTIRVTGMLLFNYNQRPIGDDYAFRDINIIGELGKLSELYVFENMINLGNVHVSIDDTQHADVDTIMIFSYCSNIVNCSFTSTASANSGCATGFAYCTDVRHCRSDSFYQCNHLEDITLPANNNQLHITVTDCKNVLDCKGPIEFTRCKNLVNCDSVLTKLKVSVSFTDCERLVNCTADITQRGDEAYSAIYGFLRCKELSNCYAKVTFIRVDTGTCIARSFQSCRGLSNCYGDASSDNAGTVIYDCSYINNCYGSAPSMIGNAILGGTNTKVDASTVQSGTDPVP